MSTDERMKLADQRAYLAKEIDRAETLQIHFNDEISCGSRPLNDIERGLISAALRAPEAADAGAVAYMSAEQMPEIIDRDDGTGIYIPLRKTAAGLFQTALYASPTAAGIAAPPDLALETTPEMRARQRDLTRQTGRDDYDRVTEMLLDDLARCLAYIAPLQDVVARRPATPAASADAVRTATFEQCAKIAADIADRYDREAATLAHKPGEGRAQAASNAATVVEDAIRRTALSAPVAGSASPAQADMREYHAIVAEKIPGYVSCDEEFSQAYERGRKDAAAAIRALPASGEADATLTPEMVRLIIAARNVAFEDHPGTEELKELDEASEAFAGRVPWENEPEDAPQP